LQRAVISEILAAEAAWRGEPDEASAHALAAVRSLTVGSVAAYRTFWKVLAAHWAAQHAAATEDPVDARVAAELSRDALASARTRAWRPPLPEVVVNPDAEALDSRAMRIATDLQKLARSPRSDRHVEDLAEELGVDSAAKFERGIGRLGQMLGFDAVRPNVKAAPDGAWRDGGTQILWEAKSEQDEGGVISVRAVRQATTHPTWVHRELDWESDADVIAIIVSRCSELDDSAGAVAGENVYMVTTEVVRNIGVEVAEMWKSLLGGVQGLALRETADRVVGELASRGLDTQALKRRLTISRVADIEVA
jgi:hypothetical protein